MPARPYDLDSPWAHIDPQVSGSDVQVVGTDRNTVLMQVKRLQNDENGIRQVVVANSFADG
ncbi:hypothetical protein [Streptomyces atriruber]|uniref:hypothetical protein n=1 Tax=Streptomyces atriruber TaxID=545121 RepID=UPI0006E2D63A|nr:hypothetical protein [Streptomyces atriruber]